MHALVPWHRDTHEIFALMGLVLNEGVARALKHMLLHPRPAEWCHLLGTCGSHGMPSSHSQCMFFALALYGSLYARHARIRTAFSAFIGAAEVLAVAAGAVVVAYARVHLHYHSIDQVVAGAVLGTLLGLAWAQLMQMLAPAYTALSDSWLGRLVELKDTWAVAEPLRIERDAFKGGRVSKAQKQQ
jgi:dolichyldiphosphatase